MWDAAQIVWYIVKKQTDDFSYINLPVLWSTRAWTRADILLQWCPGSSHTCWGHWDRDLSLPAPPDRWWEVYKWRLHPKSQEYNASVPLIIFYTWRCARWYLKIFALLCGIVGDVWNHASVKLSLESLCNSYADPIHVWYSTAAQHIMVWLVSLFLFSRPRNHLLCRGGGD